MILNLIEFPSDMFTWSDGGRSATAEASDMENRHLQRIYDDACDAGFAMKSVKTGEVVIFSMEKPIYHGDGEDTELCGWEFTPIAESQRKIPSCVNTRVTIFND